MNKSDYWKALDLPWHVAEAFIHEFVDDDEKPLKDRDHVRNLFAVAADAERQASEYKADALRWQEIAEDYRKARNILRARLTQAEKELASITNDPT